MPGIDVTEVLLDPFVAAQQLVVIRRSETVNEHGRSELVETRFMTVGSVTPLGDNSLVRQEAYSQQINSCMIVTPFKLRGASKDAVGAKFQPDIVQCSSGTFIVRVTNDYAAFGVGMVEAECVEYDYVSTAP